MRFYFPDSQDQIDPSFDFVTEQRSPFRIRQRDDLYAHEVLDPTPYTGMLVSKAMVDGIDGGAGRYSAQQRHRLYREGIRTFFRLDNASSARLDTLGDCGAFTYVRDEVPPYTVDDVIDFYEGGGFDAGLSVDHVILAYEEHAPLSDDLLPPEWPKRQKLTLDLAAEFLVRHQKRNCSFEPVGVAQGWSPHSYAQAVRHLQGLGYTRIAIGGLVPLKTPEILHLLESVSEHRLPSTELHLLGVTRCENVGAFRDFGVTSFDSTSAFRQAFKDERDNYYDLDRTWIALRVPQIEGNAKLMRRIRAGEINQALARTHEKHALTMLNAFDAGEATVDETVSALQDYERIYDGKSDRSIQYREVLEAAPWKQCDCRVCELAGIHAIVFRGTERNKRRGFHNLHVFARRLAREVGYANDRTAVAA